LHIFTSEQSAYSRKKSHYKSACRTIRYAYLLEDAFTYMNAACIRH